MRKIWSEGDKQRARELRESGKSFGEITSELGVSKSTLFTWVGKMPRPEKFVGASREEWLGELRKLALEAKKRKRKEWAMKIRNEVLEETRELKELDLKFKRAVLSLLYWAEGSKTGSVVQFVNIDPRLMLLFTTLLRECYEVNESKFRVRLHLHYYHRARKVVKFWSDLLEIPYKQFGKIYWKKRSREKVFRRNEYGICTIRYNNVDIHERLLQYAYALGERFAPVAQRIERVPAEDEM